MTLHQKSSVLLKSYGYLWLFYISFGILIAIISNWFPDIINSKYQQTELIEMAKSNPFKLFVLACIFAPIIEEMMFRTLIKPSHSDIILCGCSWLIFIGGVYIPTSINWLLKIGFLGVLLFTMHTILKQFISEQFTLSLRKKLSQYFIPVFVISSIVFGLIHISNYVTDFSFNTQLFVLVIPQIIAGFVLGWVKQKNTEITWSMGLHFMNNLVPVIIIILSNSLLEQQ